MQLKITFNICDNSNTIEKVDFKFLENFIETWGGGGGERKKRIRRPKFDRFRKNCSRRKKETRRSSRVGCIMQGVEAGKQLRITHDQRGA